MKPKIIVICGPTATGKTKIAIELAKSFGGEIINADSMQVYRHMDIGTAKPSIEEQNQIKHHLIDIVNPDEQFDAAKFASLSSSIIFDLNQKGIIPFVVGGTGLYIKSLIYGIFKQDQIIPDIRERLRQEIFMFGAPYLHNKLNMCDPESAKKIHPNDSVRILRAMETFESTGKKISEYHINHGFRETRFEALKIGLFIERTNLYERINNRVERMIEMGFLNEVEKLLNMGYSENLKPMQSIGYKHLTDYLKGRISFDEAVITLKRDTRRYAKRQLTWFNADPDIIWVNP
ncbi:MAG: tRNA (adenosine(37)-N6)-dimethylallyltransferase MiaA [Desulfobacterales bacterium]|nr:tRNA (adenosine(37)-N6)-dimethylallyltransferase MiaA [Desulfobacterales bacterium]